MLAEPNLRRFYVGYKASLLGTAMSSVAVAFAVLGTGGTATDLGTVFAANIVPMVAFLLGGGVIGDRLGRRPVMLTADLARCAAQGTLAAALFLGRPHLWLFVGTALTVGTGNVFFQPALSGLTVQVAPREQLGNANANANALFGMAQPGAQVAGPVLAGVLIAAASAAAAIAVDAGTYAVSAVALSRLRIPGRGRAQARSLLRDLAEGWAEFTARTWLWAGTVQFALFNLVTVDARGIPTGTGAAHTALRRGADGHIGLPAAGHGRVAEFAWPGGTPAEDEPAGLDDDQLMGYNAYFNPGGLSGAGVVNTARWRAAELPSTNGHGTARGIARVYAALAAGGTLDGIKVADSGALADATAEQVYGQDRILHRPSRFGLGFQLTQPERPMGPGEAGFGHFGAGGSIGCCDPQAGIAIGYVTGQMGPRWQNPRNRALIDAIYACL